MSNSIYTPAPVYGVNTDDYPPFYKSDAHIPLVPKSSAYVEDRTNLVRTPSPTPSEIEALSGDTKWWKKYVDPTWWKDWRHVLEVVIFLVIIGFVIVFTIFNKQIIAALHPAIVWMKDLRFGWLIPIAIFIVISFPPLFGHEILAILCGLVWGLGIGFAIVSAGVILGEIANYFTFKYCCKARARKLEKTSIFYASLSEVVRTGGIKIALIVRYSAVPSHFSTVVFSTCGMGFFTFLIAAILSLPKMFVHTFVGLSLAESSTGTESRTIEIINVVAVTGFVIITYIAMRYVKARLAEVTPAVVYARRKARQFDERRSLSSF
ncbi:hypothetical protein JAAARDRAFT_33202 [Jaapia argillacea MUCL 33604]|uniref:Golgi apparatus membrane protein TVP38 n=1 Tax=Jaapia argillacea MUCL 33604 TaxID=933084 RepID=A0A067Q0D5_9AGAM|nr:hypothetical protein JAAARDRAFT_33202 [Jaapia argillacea MUCL 33604]